jgi:hypothetical protein
MNADEIRDKFEHSQHAVINRDDYSLWALCEIAAQLAEKNAALRESIELQKESLELQRDGNRMQAAILAPYLQDTGAVGYQKQPTKDGQ